MSAPNPGRKYPFRAVRARPSAEGEALTHGQFLTIQRWAGWRRGGVRGPLAGGPGSHFDTQGRPDAKKTENSGSLAVPGPPFWSPFGTLFGTLLSQFAFLVVFLKIFFETHFFIDFRWPEGSRINAF